MDDRHSANTASQMDDIPLLSPLSFQWKQIFPERELRGHSPNFHCHASVSDLYIPMINLPILLQEICGPILGIYKLLTDI